MVARFEGRVQFLAVENEVRDLISKGYSYKMIHQKLVGEGKITIGYDTFYNYLRKKKKKDQPSKLVDPTPVATEAGHDNSKNFVHSSVPPKNLI